MHLPFQLEKKLEKLERKKRRAAERIKEEVKDSDQEQQAEESADPEPEEPVAKKSKHRHRDVKLEAEASAGEEEESFEQAEQSVSPITKATPEPERASPVHVKNEPNQPEERPKSDSSSRRHASTERDRVRPDNETRKRRDVSAERSSSSRRDSQRTRDRDADGHTVKREPSPELARSERTEQSSGDANVSSSRRELPSLIGDRNPDRRDRGRDGSGTRRDLDRDRNARGNVNRNEDRNDRNRPIPDRGARDRNSVEGRRGGAEDRDRRPFSDTVGYGEFIRIELSNVVFQEKLKIHSYIFSGMSLAVGVVTSEEAGTMTEGPRG